MGAGEDADPPAFPAAVTGARLQGGGEVTFPTDSGRWLSPNSPRRAPSTHARAQRSCALFPNPSLRRRREPEALQPRPQSLLLEREALESLSRK